MRKTIIVLAAAAGALGAAGPAMAAQPSDPATACKDGGYAGYVDPATGQPFVNQGGCVSFVRHGGTLVPYVPTPPPPPETVVNSFGPFAAGRCTWNVQLAGFPANSVVTVDLASNVGGGSVFTTSQRDVTTDATGSVLFTAGFPVYGGTATAATPLASDTDTVRC